MLRLFNTLTRKKELFKPIRKGRVGLYACGPSVYSLPHIGNFRTYVAEDILKRYLLYKGYGVKHVMNLTDIENKSVRAAKGNMRRMMRLTSENAKKFLAWAKELRVMPPSLLPRATENIPAMVRLISILMKKRLAYRAEDGSIYYKISKFGKYGELSKYPFPKAAFGRRVSRDDYYQRHAGDFILWRRRRKADGDVFWRTPFGEGRPGWNVECSAMSAKYLGKHFDIHAGGIDNIFSHHENEIAQSEGAFGEKPVNYWFHVRHLRINGEKMSKSLGNVYTPGDLFRKGFSPRSVRYHLLQTHYRSRLNFTFRCLREAERTLKRCTKGMALLHKPQRAGANAKYCGLAASSLKHFESAMDDNLDTPLALEVFCSTISEAVDMLKRKSLLQSEAEEVRRAVMKMDSVLRIL